MKDRKLIIVGAGGHGGVAADIAELTGYTEIVFLDDRVVDTSRVVGKTKDAVQYVADADFFVAIGDTDIRKRFFDQLTALDARIINLIHPKATVARSAVLGKGVLVAAGAVVGVNAVVGDGAIVNTCASVDHDCRIGMFVHVAVGTHIAGTVKIGDMTFVGAGTTVINGMEIVKNCTIGAGTVVTKSILETGTYVGMPAHRVDKPIEGN